MLIRVLLLVEPSGLRTRLVGVLAELGVLVSEEDDPDNLWSRLGQESHDLVLASFSALPGEPESCISEIRNLPNRPEVIVLLDSAHQDHRATLQSGGAFAVVDENLSLPLHLLARLRRKNRFTRKKRPAPYGRGQTLPAT